ncbi:MAG: S8 family serine peptidase, partial [Sphingomonadales bacterium]
TSFSAPHVSGALALLIELFPNLTTDEVIDLLLSTTVDLGAVGTDPIFGRGLIDLGEALNPQGTMTVSVATVNGVTPVPTDGSGGQTPSAFGEALVSAPLLDEAVFLDSYERGYHFDLSDRLIRSNTLPSLFSRIDQNRETAFSGFQVGNSSIQFSAQKQSATQKHLRNYLGDVAEHLTQTTQARYQFRTAVGAFELGLAYGYGLSQEMKGQSTEAELFLSNENAISAPQNSRHTQSVNLGKTLENGRLSFGFSFSDRSIDNPALFGTEPLKNRRAQNLAARYDRYFKTAAFGAELGVIRENGQLLGAPSAGALALGDGATTAYVSLDGEVDAGPNWIISAKADITRTSINQAQNSIFSDIGSFTATSFRLNAYRSAIFGKRDRLGFSISQPLKVETGSAQVTVPTAVSYSPGRTQVIFDEARFSLSPDAREIDVEIGYSWRLNNGLSLKANMLRQFNAGHVAGQSGNAVLFRMARAF